MKIQNINLKSWRLSFVDTKIQVDDTMRHIHNKYTQRLQIHQEDSENASNRSKDQATSYRSIELEGLAIITISY